MQATSERSGRILQITAAQFALVAFASAARADIFQWEYINPAHLTRQAAKHDAHPRRRRRRCRRPELIYQTAT